MDEPFFLDWLECEPYGYNSEQKKEVLLPALAHLTEWHASQCISYGRVLDALSFDTCKIKNLSDVPFIPVRLFKEFELRSIKKEFIFKTLTSSGTSGQQVSKIYLDRETASLQTKVLSRLMRGLVGKQRRPMLVIDNPSILKNRHSFSARAAGVLGFSMYGKDVTYALNESMELDLAAIEAFLERHPAEPIFIFGFTFMIWKYFALPLQKQKLQINLERGTLLHGGGWKKLQGQSVNSLQFSSTLRSVCGVAEVVNYYGMVEQTGSIFLECRAGYLHTHLYSDLIVRRYNGFQVAQFGEEGIIEVLSMLPKSYPGHALLTEDIGVIFGEDDCACGLPGKYFHVKGRIPQAEVRGCSDTHEA